MKNLLFLVSDNSEYIVILKVQQPLVEKRGGVKYGQVNISLDIGYFSN